MSGLEVVGLVLGSWPILDSLVRRTGSSLAKQAKHARRQKQLTNQLQIYRILYRGFIDRLLLGDEELSDEKRLLLGEDNPETTEALWKDQGLQTRLRHRLGDDTFELVVSGLEELLTSLKNLERKIRQGETDFSHAIGRLKSFRSLKKNLPDSEILGDMEQIRQSVENLRALIDPTPVAIYSGRSQPTNLSTGRIPNRRRSSTRHTSEYINQFYEVLQDSVLCSCAEGHEANIQISDDFFHIWFGLEDTKQPGTSYSLDSNISFDNDKTNLSSNGLEDEESSIHDLSNKLKQISISNQSDARTCWSRSLYNNVTTSSKEHRTLPLLFTPNRPRFGSDSLPVPDLCQFLKQLERTPEEPASYAWPVTFRTGEISYTARMRQDLDLKSTCVICLDERLSQTEEWQISRLNRMEIAQKLAYSVLQFHSTPWIDNAWTWRNFSMNDDKQNRPQLFVTRNLYPVAVEPIQPEKLASIWKYLPENKLVRLGFALIELGLGKRLSQLRYTMANKDAEGMSEDEQDYVTAMKLLEHNVLRDQLGDTYQAIVSACLHCVVINDTGALALTSMAESFQDDVEQHVVQPLEEFFNRNWAPVIKWQD